MSSLYFITNWLKIVGGFVGLYGAIWLSVQYFKGRILKTCTGTIIFGLSITDIANAFSYIVLGIKNVLNFQLRFPRATLALFATLDSTIFVWAILASSILLFLMAVQVLIILNGVAKIEMSKYKTWSLLIGLLGPFIIFLLPTSLALGTTPFLYSIKLGNENWYQILLILMHILPLGLALITFIIIQKKLNSVLDENSSGSTAAVHILRLVMFYMVAILVSQLPWIIRNCIFIISDKGDNYWLKEGFSAVSLAIMIKDLITPMRGYIHSIAVYFAYTRYTESKNDSFFTSTLKPILLLSNINGLNDSQEGVDIEKASKEVTPWEFTFADDQYLHSANITHIRTTDQY